MNFHNQIEPSNTNIEYFDGLNWCQQHLSLFTIGIR